MNGTRRWLSCAALAASLAGMTACAGKNPPMPADAAYAYTADKAASHGPAPAVEGYRRMAENDHLGLYIREDTASAAVYEKESGRLFETGADGGGAYQSQFTLFYSDINGKITSMNSFAESVKRDQATVTAQKEGMRVDYVVGDNARGVSDLPKKIRDDRFRPLVYNKVTAEEQKFLEKRYSYNEDTKIWTLRNVSNKQYISRLLEIFDQAGYTAKHLAEDNLANNIPASAVARKIYKVSLLYTLEGDSLKVTLPMKELSYPQDYPLVQINLLEFFGADKGNDGYMLLPDGSGAIMDFRQAGASSKGYSAPVYGPDLTQPVSEQGGVSQNVFMPVFGIKKSGSAIFGIIESGEALASIEANNAGAKNDFNHIFPSFTVIRAQAVTMGGSLQSSYNKFQQRPYQGDAAVRYFFLSGEKADYSHMAACYRQYLTGRYALSKLEPDEAIPFYLQTVGAIDVTKSFLGVRYGGQEALTEFKDNMDMLRQLDEAGVRNVKLRLLGWTDGGMNQALAKTAEGAKALGGQTELRRLADYCRGHGAELYPNMQFMTFQKDAGTLAKYRYGAKTLDGKEAHANFFNPATMGINNQLDAPYRIIVSPSELSGLVGGFLKGYRKLGVPLSVEDLGRAVYSDYNGNRQTDRQSAYLAVREQAQKLKESTERLMLDGANLPLAVLADDLVNVPSGSSSFFFESSRIPFYQMVMHGYRQMGSGPLNFAADYQQAFLRAVEGGTAVSYKWIYKNMQAVKTSDYADLYAADYALWIGDAADSYHQLNRLLAPLQDQVIIRHEILQSGVTKTTYENGTSVYVNYNAEPVTAENRTIGAQSFLAAEGGANV